jgi:signal transduction histidine kinase
MTPPQTFAALSLVLIIAIVVATSVAQSTFYRHAIINRESSTMSDLVYAITLQQESEGNLTSADLRDYTESKARSHLEHSFNSLKSLRGEALIKVYNPDQIIVWSDSPELIGTKASFNKADLARASGGEVRAVLNSRDLGTRIAEGFRQPSVIEFYVPFTLKGQGTSSNTASGVVSIYLYQEDVDRAIFQGTLLLWLITGLGGAVLFASLYRLFYSVYHKQREAESQFAKLSTEHERILQMAKLSALGQMVGEIAHQLNNPLVGVVNLAELAQREADNPERVRELLADVRRAGEDCRGFVQRMLQFNAASRFEPRPTDMNQLTRETIAFFQQSMTGHPDVSLEAPGHSLMLSIDPVLMRHALFNLIHNAALSEPKGPVVVSLARDDRKDASGYRITVSDRGSGIKPEVAAKLFTPFFTTRPGGTGLGLSVTQHIIAQHGGSIQAENNPGGGARFVIWLPALEVNA